MQSFFHAIGELNFFSSVRLLKNVQTPYTTHISCICPPTHEYTNTVYHNGLQVWQRFSLDWQAEKCLYPGKSNTNAEVKKRGRTRDQSERGVREADLAAFSTKENN